MLKLEKKIKYFPYFENCISALDSTHLLVYILVLVVIFYQNCKS